MDNNFISAMTADLPNVTELTHEPGFIARRIKMIKKYCSMTAGSLQKADMTRILTILAF